MSDLPTAPVVVLEESYPVRFRMKSILAAHGYEVVTAKNKRELFTPAALSSFPTDLKTADASLFIIGDRLPDSSGLDVVKWLKGSKRWSATPVMMVGGPLQTTEVLDAFALGVSAYVLKPINESDFIKRVAAALGRITLECSENLPCVSYNAHDLLAKEVSRAKRFGGDLSVLVAEITCQRDNGKSEGQVSCELPARWRTKLLDAVRSAFRDIDTIIPYSEGTLIAALPGATASDVETLCERVHSTAEPVLAAIMVGTGIDVTVQAAGAGYGVATSDWQTMVESARQRLASTKTPNQPAEIRGRLRLA